MDTEAHISLVKIGTIYDENEINTSHIINIRGITQEVTPTLGTIILELIQGNFIIEHEFHVLENDTPIPTDGIIGKDFLKMHECIINYQNMTIYMPKISLEIPIQSEDKLIIPPSSESYACFNIRSAQFPCIIPSRAISHNSRIPTTIAYGENTFIRIINTSNRTYTLPNNILYGERLDDFKIYTNEQFQSMSRCECPLLCMKPYYRTVLEILTEKIPKDAPRELYDLCYNHMPIFHDCKNKLTVNNFYKQDINLTDNTPIYVKNYRLPQVQKAEIKNQVDGLLKDDLIEIGQSSYNSPLIIVPKKSTDGTKKYRMCVDYRLLNRKIIPDKFPLPRIEDILDNLGNSKYFSVMDLQSGFHQIPLNEGSRPMTAFSTDRGMYQWKVLPFGLNIAPSSFSRMMHLAFSELGPNIAFVYMDDLIVLGRNEKEHLENLEKVFGICLHRNLKLNPEKCEFFKTEVSFLGHKCTSNGLLPDPAKIEAVKNYPIPQNKDDIKRFIAFCNYYRRFIPNFAKISVPLTKLLCKRVEFVWNSETENAFHELRNTLISHPILRHPDFTKEFIVHVDASQFACGAVLSQTFENGDQPIMYISKTFKKGELNKPIIEKELLAIHFAITTLRPYLYGIHFTVKTDHKPLIYMYNLKNPASKLTRIRLELEEYDFTIEYIRGKDNVMADALSRIKLNDLRDIYGTEQVLATTRSMTKTQTNNQTTQPPINEKPIGPRVIESMNTKFDIKIPRMRLQAVQINENDQSKVNSVVVCAYQKHKKIFEFIIDKMPGNEILTLKSLILQLQNAAGEYDIKQIQWPMDDFIFTMCTVNDFKQACNETLNELTIILVKRPILIKNNDEKLELMSKFHNDALYGGHCGQGKMYARLRASYYWKGMTRDVKNFVKNCENCIVNKVRPKNIEQMKRVETPQSPFDVVIIDTIGPFQRSHKGNVYAVTMICDLSKYLVVVPIPNKSAKEVAKAIFEKFILVYGPMRSIRTDRGTEYRNELIQELCTLMRIKHNTSTAYHHETVGAVERNHRTFNEYLRSYVRDNITNWETFLHYFAFCYNIQKHASLENVYSPYEIVFNKNVPLPTEIFDGKIDPLYKIHDYVFESKYRLQLIHEKTRELLDKIKKRNKEYYDKKAKPLDIRIGDDVLLEIQPYNKHSQKYVKCKVKNIIDENVEILTKNNKTELVHKNRIRKI